MTALYGDVLGAIIAGGVSSRFGSPKALAVIHGETVIARVHRTLGEALGHDRIIAIVNDTELAYRIGLPHSADVRPGFGALSGLHAALLRARDDDRRGVLAVGCDMPLLEPPLLRLLLLHYREHDAVLPESEGPRGVEPLCAWYAHTCLPAIEAAMDRDDARLVGFHRDVDVHRLPLAQVRSAGEPAHLFMNLNTPSDLERASRIAAS